jgi:putative DNA primase/helicase
MNEMDKIKKAVLLDEMKPYIADVGLTDIAKQKVGRKRTGSILDALCNIISMSPMGNINGAPYYYNGRYYERMEWSEFNDLIRVTLDMCGVPKDELSSLTDFQNAAKDTLMNKKLRIDMGKFIMADGVYDIKTKSFEKGFSPSIIQTVAVDYGWEPREMPIQWMAFLSEVLPEEKDVELLQMFLGATLMSRREAKIETMLVLYGTGANGKSVVFETVKGVLGNDNVTHFGISEIMKDGDQKKNIAMMNGRRLNYCSEIRSYFRDDRYDDILKVLISGEPMTARPMYGENFTAYDIPLLMANTNFSIYESTLTSAMRRRMRQIKFGVKIDGFKQDKRLACRLKKEYPAIFRWMVIGLDKLRAENYTLPDDGFQIEVIDDVNPPINGIVSVGDTQGKDMRLAMIDFFNDKHFCEKWSKDTAKYILRTNMELYTEMTEWIGENHLKVAGWNKRDFLTVLRTRFRFKKTRPSNIETWHIYVPYSYFDYKRDSVKKVKS